MKDIICNKDKEGNTLPLWFDGMNSCLDYLNGKCGGSFLYFFRIDENLFKVGISNHIVNRLKTHQKNLGDRIGTVGIIGNVTLYKQIEYILHYILFNTKGGDGKYLFESNTFAYDTETYNIPEGVSDFKEMIELVLKLLRSVYLYNSFEQLGEGESFGFDLFNPKNSDKGLSTFLLKYNDVL